ncbi:hypothetical protein LTR56_024891 [Elasticomyces elasticus]|nr:hypothetical protein LTR56_024891 [Elasticomyces elasticus]KAK3620184.1 hypothetical protein LTR22_025698 [Elasticomyces elasticus]KAK4905560.1 hypothetical protein LTR49_025158 [Elasticomyces elasticus]
MAPISNLSLIFKRVPEGIPVPGIHLVMEDRPCYIQTAPQGGFVARNLYNSMDPYMRMMMIDPATEHYRASFKLDQPVRSLAVAEVIASSHPHYPAGTIIRASLPIAEYSTVTAQDQCLTASTDTSGAVKVLPAPTGRLNLLPYWLGPLGMPGLTAFSSIYEIGRIKTSEVIFISAAAGAVGSMVGQICKLEGLRVIGSAGSDKKVDVLIHELGFDGAFNYKRENVSAALSRLAPEGLDIYYDNVGGQTLEDALAHMRQDGRVVVCGMVSQYSSTSARTTSQGSHGVKNLFQLVSRNLTMRGFQVGNEDFGRKYMARHEEQVMKWVVEGHLKPVVSEMSGIRNGANAFVGMLNGESIGKAVLRICPEAGSTADSPFTRVA